MPEQIAITCPHCAFRRSVPPEMIPDGARQATCPQCRQPFPLNAQTISLEAAPSPPPDDGPTSPPPFNSASADPTPPAAPPQQTKPSGSRRLAFSFNGSGREYFGIWIVNTLLQIVTLGIYTAWAKVRRRRYFYGSTTLDGHSFDYLADPLTLFKGWLIAALAAVLYGVGTRVSPILSGAIALIVFAAFPWLVVRSRMFNCRNSAHRNIRFSFKPDYRQAYVVFAGLAILTPFTLGLLAPYMIYRQKKFLVENSAYGTTPFSFDARVKDLYLLALKVAGCFIAMFAVGAGVLAMTGGLAAGALAAAQSGLNTKGMALVMLLLFPLLYFIVIIYAQTLLANLTLNATALDGARLVSSLRTRDMAWLFVSNALAIAFSLGLFMPWATVRMARYRMERLELQPANGLDHLLGSSRSDEVGAAGEEIGDLFGFSVDVAL